MERSEAPRAESVTAATRQPGGPVRFGTAHPAAGAAPLARFYAGLLAAGFLATLAVSFGLGGPSPGTAAWGDLVRSAWTWRSLGFSAAVAAASSLVSVTLAVPLALFLHGLPRGQASLAGIYKTAVVLPHLAVGYLAVLLFSRTGLIGAALVSAGLVPGFEALPDPFAGGGGPAIVLAYVFKETPYAVLMLHASLRKLDPRLAETARMLGADRGAVFRGIVLPHLAPTLTAVAAILFLYTFGAFDLPWVLGSGDPAMLGIEVYGRYFLRDLSARPRAAALLSTAGILSFLAAFAVFGAGRSREDRLAALRGEPGASG